MNDNVELVNDFTTFFQKLGASNELSNRNFDTGDFFSEEYCNYVLGLGKKYGLYEFKDKYPMLKLHFTEAGPRLFDHYDTDWCKWGIMISKAIKCSYSSFTGWNLMLNEMGGPNVGPFLCGGLVTRNTNGGEISYSGQYKAFEHIARYINEKSKIYPVSVGEEYDLPMNAYPQVNRDIEGFCIDNNDSKNVFILINPNADKRQIQIDLNGTWWYAELTPESISTLIIE